MATTTTNFNFPIPQSTDLVKDGATAIAALGTSVDTQFVDLKGGTTGQVLSKASGTDLDFTWVAQDDSNAIQNAIVDAKGDLIAATAADTPARLAVGTNGQVLTADSTASTGLAWATPAVSFAENGILNGAMQVWQRSTSVTPTSNGGAYTADRWFVTRGSNTSVTVSRQTTSDTTNLPNIQYCARVQRTASSTTTSDVAFGQMFETISSIPFAGKTVVLSGYIRKGADFSATSNALTMQIVTGTGTDQKQMDGGYTGQATSVTGNVTITSTWTRFSVTGTIPTTATEITPKFLYTPTGTAGTNDYFEITGVQLEVGSTASAFHTNQPTIATELAACQRYYHRFTGGGSSDSLIGSGLGFSTTVAMFVWHLGTTMRIAPSSMDLSNQGIYRPANATAYSGGTWSLNQAFDNSVRVIYTHGSAIFTAGESLILSSTNATNFIGFSAEL